MYCPVLSLICSVYYTYSRSRDVQNQLCITSLVHILLPREVDLMLEGTDLRGVKYRASSVKVRWGEDRWLPRCFRTYYLLVLMITSCLAMIVCVCCRCIGGLLALFPQFCFLLEDETGICGYAVSTPNVQEYQKKLVESWLPLMKKKYPNPEKDIKNTSAQVCVGCHCL